MEGLFKIAELVTYIYAPCKRLIRTSDKYKTDKKNIDISLILTEEKLSELQGKYPNYQLDDLAYMATGSMFHRQILNYNALMLHSSAVSYKGMGIAFSAPSGTGKSTHASLWKQKFQDDVVLINDDKPVIRKKEDGIFIYGTPWSGKTDINENVKAPLKAIVFIEQYHKNELIKCDKNKALVNILASTVHPKDKTLFNNMLTLVEEIIKNIDAYTLRCTASLEAVEEAFKVI